jgi:hypothetical protein
LGFLLVFGCLASLFLGFGFVGGFGCFCFGFVLFGLVDTTMCGVAL